MSSILVQVAIMKGVDVFLKVRQLEDLLRVDRISINEYMQTSDLDIKHTQRTGDPCGLGSGSRAERSLVRSGQLRRP